MNSKVKLAIAVVVGVVGGGIISNLGGGESTTNTLLGSNPVGDFPEWTRDGSAFRCRILILILICSYKLLKDMVLTNNIINN